MSDHSILIVEDEIDILNLLQFNFQSQGFMTYTAQDGKDALDLAEKHPPDLVLLDLMLPGMDGLEVCKALKSSPETKDVPVIMLTARGEEKDRISGFELGADDYVVKPFSPRELVLRVQAILKRSQSVSAQPSEENIWEHKGLRIEFDAFRVYLNEQEIELTVTEFHLLAALVRSKGRVLTREHLLDQVWGYEFVGYARTVDTHMHRLRQKMGEYSDWIQTVRGVGYRLRLP